MLGISAASGEIDVGAHADADRHVTALAGGGFVVSWLGDDENSIGCQIYSPNGVPVGDALQLALESAPGSSIGTYEIVALQDGGLAISVSAYRLVPDEVDSYESWLTFQIFNGAGDPVGALFESRGSTESMVVLTDGRIALAMDVYEEKPYSEPNIHVQLFSPNGTTSGAISVPTVSGDQQFYGNVVALHGGGFAVFWADYFDITSSDTRLEAQIYDATGTKVGGVLNLGIQADANEHSFDHAIGLKDGGFAVLWSDGVPEVLSVRTYSATGQLLESSTVPQGYDGRLTALESGGFALDFTKVSADGTEDVFVRIYGTDGLALTGDVLVNTATAGDQGDSKIVALNDGGFAVAWEDSSHGVGGAAGDQSGIAVKLQIFDASGSKVGQESLVNIQTAGDQFEIEIVRLGDGRFAVAWDDAGGPADLTKIRIFTLSSLFTSEANKVDFNSLNSEQFALVAQGANLYSAEAGDDEVRLPNSANFQLTASVKWDNLKDFHAGLGSDTVTGGNAADRIFGDEGTDTIRGGGGNDRIDGGDGLDTAEFSGGRSSYTLRFDNKGDLLVIDEAGSDGTDTVKSVEFLRFADYKISTDFSRDDYLRIFYQEADDFLGGAASPQELAEYAWSRCVQLRKLDPLNTDLRDAEYHLLGIESGLGSGMGLAFSAVYAPFYNALKWVAGKINIGGWSPLNLMRSDPNTPNSAPGGTYDVWGGILRGRDGTWAKYLDGDPGKLVPDGPAGTMSNHADAGLSFSAASPSVKFYFRGGDTADETLEVDGVQYSSASVTSLPTNEGPLMVFDRLGGTFGLSQSDDVLIAGNGGIVHLNDGNDVAVFSGPAARVFGDAGNDQITTDDGKDYLDGGAGNDTLAAGNGDDVLIGGEHLDFMDGGDGSDIYAIASAADHISAEINDSGLNGTDEVRFSATSEGTLKLFADDKGIERIVIGTGTNATAALSGTVALNVDARLLGNAVTMVGNSGANILQATAFADTLQGGVGIDRLYGYAGDDTLDGGRDADAIYGGAGDDTYIVDNSSDALVEVAGEGTDTAMVSVAYTLRANVENLVQIGALSISGSGNALANMMTGNAGANKLYGLAGNDTIVGNAGNDTLDGGAGVDTLIGGVGNDIYGVDDAGDSVTELAGEGADRVDSSISYTLGANLENLTLLGSAAIDGTGNELANVIKGNAGANILSGNGGNDKLYGGAGDDQLHGGDGVDWLEGGTGRDELSGGAGGDRFVFRTGDLQGGTVGTIDVIGDFVRGEGDKIRLDLTDANTTLAGTQDFIFIGTGGFTGVAGQLRYETSGGNSVIWVDTDGDSVADAGIQVLGVTSLMSSDFIF